MEHSASELPRHTTRETWHPQRGNRGPNKADDSAKVWVVTPEMIPLRLLEDALGVAHRSLQVKGLDILPILLEQRNQKVNRHVDVGEKLLVGHLDVANSHTKAERLLQLELDSRLDLVNLIIQLLSVLHESRKLTGLVKTGSQETGNHLDESLRGQESVVLLCQLLDELLVLVKLLEVLNVHEGDINLLSLLAMLGISKNAHSHVGAWNTGKLDGATETLVLLGIVVLETDLKLYGLTEFTLLLSALLEHRLDRIANGVALKLTHFG
jgi:hypothetical protein